MIQIGYTFVTHQGYEAIVVEYFNSIKIKVEIDGHLITTRQQHIRSGRIKNPYHPEVFNVGYVGQGQFNPKTHRLAYSRWQRLLERCYCPKWKSRCRNYNGCTVAKLWHNFQNFAKWFYDNYVEGWEVDKDLLGNKKEYSESNCCFIPQLINKALRVGINSGVRLRANGSYQVRCTNRGNRIHVGEFKEYIEAVESYYNYKDNYMKTLAEEFKNNLSPIAYKALLYYNSKNRLEENGGY